MKLTVVSALPARDARCSLALGLALRREGDRERALKALQQAASFGAKDAALRVEIGVGLEALDALDDAEHEYRVALDLDGKCESAYRKLAVLLLRTNRAKKAVEILRRALRKTPGNVELTLLLANALDNSGNTDHAVGILRELVERAPDHLDARRSYARLLNRTSDPNAVAAWKAVLRIAASDREALEAIAELYSRAGQTEEELAIRRELASGSPQETAFAFSGDLATFGVAEIIEFLRMQRASGTLSLRAERGDAQVQLRGGMIVDATSPAMEQLDVRLIDSARMFQSMPDGTIEPSAYDPQLLTELITTQLLQALREVTAWASGQFRFRRESEQEGSAPLVELDPQFALLEVMRQNDEAQKKRARC